MFLSKLAFEFSLEYFSAKLMRELLFYRQHKSERMKSPAKWFCKIDLQNRPAKIRKTEGLKNDQKQKKIIMINSCKATVKKPCEEHHLYIIVNYMRDEKKEEQQDLGDLLFPTNRVNYYYFYLDKKLIIQLFQETSERSSTTSSSTRRWQEKYKVFS